MTSNTNDKINYLAENLRVLRNKRNYTQEEFSKLSGLPRSTITNIESGESNPTLSKVIAIADALGVTIDELISKPVSAISLYKEEDLEKELRGNNVEIFKLFPEKVKEVAIDKVVVPIGQTFRGHPHLRGAKEYLTVFQGQLEANIHGEKVIVEENEVLAFPGDITHSYRNIGDRELIYISIVLPKFK